jgi:hypothetical protein
MKNPYLNALLALGYIGALVLGINYGGQLARETPDTLLIPIAMLSLFVLSASVMGYLFLMQPALLFFDGKKQEAVSFFFKTIVTFAATTLLLLATVFLIIPLL